MKRKARLFAIISTALLSASLMLASPMAALAGTTAQKDNATAATSVALTLNGRAVDTKSPPIVADGAVFLPLRDTAGLLGTNVSWNAGTGIVTMNYPKLTIKLTYGSSTATINGKETTLEAPLQLMGGVMYVPLRFFSEAIGVAVSWDQATRTAKLTQTDRLIRAGIGTEWWLDAASGELYAAKDDQSPAIEIGRVDADLQGDVTLDLNGSSSMKNGVVTIVDAYRSPSARHVAYEVLIQDGKVIAQQKAVFEHRYDRSLTLIPLSDGKGGWIYRRALTDGRKVTLYDDEGRQVDSYDLPKLAGADGVYALSYVGSDFLIVRPDRTGLLTLIDKKDGSVTALANKLLSGKDLDYALHNAVPYPGDELIPIADMSHGQLDFFYKDPLAGANEDYERLTYWRPSYAAERAALPKPPTVAELAAGCSPEKLEQVYVQDADQIYIPLNGDNPADRDKIGTVCGILKKFADRGTREDVPKVPNDQFFHGMDIELKDGRSATLYMSSVDKLVFGATGGKDSLVLNDAAAYRDFQALKVMPYVKGSPNPARFGDLLHLEGNTGDGTKSGKLVVYWWQTTDTSSTPRLKVYEGATNFGSYDVRFSMPLYGTTDDGRKLPLAPGKGYLTIAANSSQPYYPFELLPARNAFLSVNGVPATDAALVPVMSGGHAYLPLRAIASLTGKSVAWDASTRSVLVRTPASAVKGAPGKAAQLWIDGKPAATELKPIILGGTAYVPVRAITAAFGLPVAWNAVVRGVDVTIPAGAVEADA